MKAVKKFFDIVYWILLTICKIGFIGMVVITSWVIINRYFIKSPMSWGEPVVLMFMVYMSLISTALAIRKDVHIRMQIIDFLVPEKAMPAIRAFGQILIFGFGLFLFIYGCKFTRIAGRNVITGMTIKSSWLFMAGPIAGAAIVLMEIERFINFWARVAKGEHLHVGKGLEEEAEALIEDAAEIIENSEDFK